MVDLGMLPGSYAIWPMAINNQSQVVGWAHGPSTQYRAFKWTAATGMLELPPPAGYTDNRATDISENGIICGVAQNGLEGPPRSWRLINGVYELLPTSVNGCQGLFANAVNDDGIVVGTIVGSQTACPNTYGFYFINARNIFSIPALNALDINNSGVATGQGFPEAYRYTPPTGVVPAGSLPDPYEHSEGRAINEDSDIAGRAIQHLTGRDPWKAIFIAGAGPAIEISPTLYARRSAEALNNLDHAVGSDGTTSSSNQYPWFWSAESGRVLLTQRVTLPPNYFNLHTPSGINDIDQIITRAMRQTGAEYDSVALLLTPVVQGDATGDGRVNVSDLLAVIGQWGACAAVPAACQADITRDRTVNVSDLLMVVSHWD